MTTFNKVKIGLLVSLLIFIVFKFHICTHQTNNTKVNLPENVKEQITYNPKTHEIYDVNDNGETKQIFSKNPPTIEQTKNGEVIVKADTWGFEHDPWIGISYGDKVRLNLGCNFFYVYKFDTGFSIAPALSSPVSLRVLITESYNIYSNTSLFVGLDPIETELHKVPSIHGGINLRF